MASCTCWPGGIRGGSPDPFGTGTLRRRDMAQFYKNGIHNTRIDWLRWVCPSLASRLARTFEGPPERSEELDDKVHTQAGQQPVEAGFPQ